MHRTRPRRTVVAAVVVAGLGLLTSTAPPATAAESASLYVIQGVDGTTMAISVDGRSVDGSAESTRVVGPVRLSAGRHTVTATPAGGGAAVKATVSVKAGSSTDVVLHRQADATKPPVLTAYTNDLSAVTPGSSRLTVAHTAAVGPADIRVKGKVLFANVANGEQLTLTVPAGTYPVDIVPTAADGPVVFGPVDLTVRRSTLTRVFAIGVAETGSMAAVVQVLPVAARGSGADPTRVDAGDGGQAQGLIAAHRSGGTTTGSLVPAGVAGLVLLLAAARMLRRPALPVRRVDGPARPRG